MNPISSINSINSINPIASRFWYVIQTKLANERRVETHLLNQGIEVLLPMLETFQYPHGNMVQKIKPLFPNYLFGKLDINVHYYKVKWTRGVNRILGNGVEPIPISEKVILTIKERMGENNLVKLEDEWKEGDLVHINSGPFKEMVGIFQKKMSDRGRVKILLNLLGVDVPVQIFKWQIKKVA